TLYDERNRVAHISRARGYELIKAGSASITDSSDFGKKEFIYDANGNLIAETDWKNQVTRHSYDQANRKFSTTNRDGKTMQVQAFDGADNKLRESDYAGNIHQYEYDALNRLRFSRMNYQPGPDEDSLEYTLETVYDDEGRIIETKDGKNYSTTFGYDQRNLKTSRTNARNKTYYWRYDENGNLTEEEDEEGRVTKTLFDADNRPTETTRAFDTADASTSRITEYDGNANPIKVADARGKVTTTTYDKLNRPTHIVDPLDGLTQIVYDAVGNKIQQADARGNSRHFGYDSLSRLRLTRAADGGVSKREYDANGNLTLAVDSRGMRTTTSYDLLDRPEQVTEAEGDAEHASTTSFDRYDNLGNPERITDPRGSITEHRYNARSERIQTIEAYGTGRQRSTQFHYDPNGNLAKTVNARQYITEHSYDELNRLTDTTEAKGQTLQRLTSFAYDEVGNMTGETDGRGTSTTHVYDHLNRLISSTKPQGANAQGQSQPAVRMVLNQYDPADNLIKVTDALNRETNTLYDDLNRPTRITYDDASYVIQRYDPVGNLLEYEDELRRVTSHGYDAENRRTRTTNPDNETTLWSYDTNGNRIKEIEPRGTAAGGSESQHTWRYDFDPLNRLSQVISPLGNTTRYEYDAGGNLTNQYDAANKHVQYVFDELGRRTELRQHRASGGTLVSRFEYDNNDNLTAQVDPLNQRTEYDYDALDRQSRVDFANTVPGGGLYRTSHIETAYDANNNITSIVETKLSIGTGGGITDTTSNSYDKLDRLIIQNQRGAALSFAYDAVGNRLSVTSPEGTTSYSYDQRNRLQTLSANGEITTYVYTDNGLLHQRLMPHDISSETLYEADDRIASITHRTGSQARISISYSYDANGNRLSEVREQAGEGGATSIHTTSYIYDRDDRLTEHSVLDDSHNRRTRYTLDAVGNRSGELETHTPLDDEQAETIETDRVFSYDDLHRLTAITLDGDTQPDIEYSYDDNGNPTQKIDNSGAQQIVMDFAYDSRDQLTQLIRGPPGSQEILGRYDYNYSGLRVRHRDSSRGDVDTLYDPHSGGQGAVLEEHSPSGGLIAHYRYGLKAHSIASLDTDTQDADDTRTDYYQQDALGSTVALSDSNGETSTSYRLNPWGEIEEQQGDSLNRQIFTGQEHDTRSGLIYFGARFYDPDVGRFINQDSYLGEPGTPPSLNRYLYAYGNPTVYLDPDGRQAYGSGMGCAFRDCSREELEQLV
ncbi:MAG: RHS repeat-associated core domain-containing protein, partial [Halioglobus sp.]